tara:strand:+ start:121 stop:615 length:495 start_codon:yes stop_codon:yes gene_type:complete
MAHFAKLNDSNVVLSVEVVDDADTLKDGVEDEATGVTFLTNVHGWSLWKKCSYNTREGKHYTDGSLSSDQSKAFRKNYPGIGFTYDASKDAFIPPKPYNSWTLNDTTCNWEPPVTYPSVISYDDPAKYYEIKWDETNLRWIGLDAEDPQGSHRWDASASAWVAI